MAFTVYRPGSKHTFPQASYHPSNRGTGQIILTGTDPVLALVNGIFWLEQVQAAAAVIIKDGTGETISPALTNLESDMSPVRCDHGIQVTGTVTLIKGFIQEGCLS